MLGSIIFLHAEIIVEEIQDCDDGPRPDRSAPPDTAEYVSPEIIISHNGKQITTPRTIPFVPIEAFAKQKPGPAKKPETAAVQPEPKLVKVWDRPGTVSGYGGSDGRKLLDSKPVALGTKGTVANYGKAFFVSKEKKNSAKNDRSDAAGRKGNKNCLCGSVPTSVSYEA